jgi:ATP-dependent exoDNAse (exonuclease V) beta subunit (contains helicase and exonuclease domains)
MKLAGVPFTRYKDSNLFYGRECAEWISLFKAINATDFSAWNRRILNEVLITDFFAVALSDVESEFFDDPFSKPRQMICHWKELASERRFAEMQESIYAESEVEKRLSDLSKLQEFTKLRQIGNYAINYLYNHSCTLDDLIRHLQNLSISSGDADDQDSNLVAKGSDFDAVQVMTIHASKGLEFPVVISVAGFKQLNKNTDGPYLYHESDSIHLGYGQNAKNARQESWEARHDRG